MVIAKLWGGLGNQLFQYAAAFSLAQRLQTEVVLDPRHCYDEVIRPYELDHFNIRGHRWTRSEQPWIERMVRLARPSDESTGYAMRPLKRVLTPLIAPYFKYVKDKYQGFDSTILSLRGHIYMTGTWACENYFSSHEQLIRKEFSFSTRAEGENLKVLELIRACESVGIHVRRGDYVSNAAANKRYGLCSLEYYQKAIQFISERIVAPTFFVFSDDPQWARENILTGHKTFYISHNQGEKSWEDFRLMTECRNFIIANSTFSWWAAWLGANVRGTVIAPRRWTLDPVGTDDPVPSRWIRL
jgi:hypothetical protein